jgi:hypothetical protein
MSAFVKSVDTILWGRKTYDVALGFTGGTGVGYGKRVKKLRLLAPSSEVAHLRRRVRPRADPRFRDAVARNARKGRVDDGRGGAHRVVSRRKPVPPRASPLLEQPPRRLPK